MMKSLPTTVPLAGRALGDQRRATVTVLEAAEILGVGRNQAYEGVKNGQIPVIRIGKRLLVPMAALERMLQGAT
jgi:excisionase family DNA binding protein